MTATEYVTMAADGNLSQLARDIGITPWHLITWVREPSRGLLHERVLLISKHLGIPCIAIREKSRPIGEAVLEEMRRTARRTPKRPPKRAARRTG